MTKEWSTEAEAKAAAITHHQAFLARDNHGIVGRQ
jgi:hypothetical protein